MIKSNILFLFFFPMVASSMVLNQTFTGSLKMNSLTSSKSRLKIEGGVASEIFYKISENYPVKNCGDKTSYTKGEQIICIDRSECDGRGQCLPRHVCIADLEEGSKFHRPMDFCASVADF